MVTTQAQYEIGGMSCSFCAETITTAYTRTDGVEDVHVSLAHEEVLVMYDDEQVSALELQDTLRNLGYTIRDPDKHKRAAEQQAELDRGRRRLLFSGAASALSIGVMGVMVARNGWDIFAETEAVWMWYGALALALTTMFGPGWYIKEKAYYSLRRRIFNQHVLLEAGAFAGLLGGFLGWFVFTDFPVVHFFVVSTFITTYHILSEYTSLLVRTRASRAVHGLLELQPETARQVTPNGDVNEVEVAALEVGDRIRVRPGATIPVDGRVVDGASTVDESAATGESGPLDKQPGDAVIGGSVNHTGTLVVEVTATGDDAFLNQVAHQIEEARAMKPGIVQLADRVIQSFVPGVLTVAGASFLFWAMGWLLLTGQSNVERAAFAALAVLVLGYPCALGMATPLALIRGGGEAAKRGILMRSGNAFQVFKDVETVVFDKTGTITHGEPTVAEIVAVGTWAEPAVLKMAASAEAFSEHPLALAILDHAESRNVSVPDPSAFESVTGKGVRATVEGSEVLVGKPRWLDAEGFEVSTAVADVERLRAAGLTVVGVVVDGEVAGLFGLGDEVKADAAATVDRLVTAGITPVLLTGDNERTAQTVAGTVGIDRVMADVLPGEKRAEISRLQADGDRVAMVGDGINDAPALTQADIGIAIGAGTDIAIEAADVVLLGDRLGGVMDAHEIGTRSYRKTRQNLVGAFSFNGIGVSAATTGLVHPVFAMIAMVLSVSAVLANSFAGQLLAGEGIPTDFSVAAADLDEGAGLGNTKPAQEDEAPPAAGVAADNSVLDEPTHERVTFSVNLHCSGCEQRVTETLAEWEGIRTVAADADDQRVTVEFDSQQIRLDHLRNTIDELGFAVEMRDHRVRAD